LNIAFKYILKSDLFILTTLVYSAALLTDFSYTNFTVGYSDARTDSVFAWTLSCCTYYDFQKAQTNIQTL